MSLLSTACSATKHTGYAPYHGPLPVETKACVAFVGSEVKAFLRGWTYREGKASLLSGSLFVLCHLSFVPKGSKFKTRGCEMWAFENIKTIARISTS